MCFADIDHKTLVRETEERLAGVTTPLLALNLRGVAADWAATACAIAGLCVTRVASSLRPLRKPGEHP